MCESLGLEGQPGKDLVPFKYYGCRPLGEGGLAADAVEAKGLERTRSKGDERYLLTLNTLQGVLFLIAGHAEVLVVFRDEALGADGLLAAAADEAGLVPAAVLVLHLAGTCHESREAAAES